MEGFENEFDFVLLFNNKKVKNLTPILQDFIYSIFNNISQDDVIKSWKNHKPEKADIFLKIRKAIKGISIKMGSRNSVHVETILSFKMFLQKHHIPQNIINEYLKFHYADGAANNTGKIRLDAKTYKILNQNKINQLNNFFHSEELIKDCIDRFILKGNNCNYDISAIILGTPNNFLWLTTKDIITILLKHKNNYCSSPHFSDLICQPMNRCINQNKKYERFRNYVQIKWYNLFDDIIESMNDKYQSKS